MFGLTFLQVVGLVVSFITIFSAVAGGIIWLIRIATSKGEAQASAIKEDIQEMSRSFTSSLHSMNTSLMTTIDLKTQLLAGQIQSNDAADRERSATLDQRIKEHNKSVTGQLEDIKGQQNRQLDFIKTVDGKAVENTRVISKVSNRVSIIEGALRINNG